MKTSDFKLPMCTLLFRDLLTENICKQSISRKANCWDNAISESFLSDAGRRKRRGQISCALLSVCLTAPPPWWCSALHGDSRDRRQIDELRPFRFHLSQNLNHDFEILAQ